MNVVTLDTKIVSIQPEKPMDDHEKTKLLTRLYLSELEEIDYSNGVAFASLVNALLTVAYRMQITPDIFFAYMEDVAKEYVTIKESYE